MSVSGISKSRLGDTHRVEIFHSRICQTCQSQVVIYRMQHTKRVGERVLKETREIGVLEARLHVRDNFLKRALSRRGKCSPYLTRTSTAVLLKVRHPVVRGETSAVEVGLLRSRTWCGTHERQSQRPRRRVPLRFLEARQSPTDACSTQNPPVSTSCSPGTAPTRPPRGRRRERRAKA